MCRWSSPTPVTEPESSALAPTPASSRRWLVPGVVLALAVAGGLALRATRQPAPAPPAPPAPAAVRGPSLTLSVWSEGRPKANAPIVLVSQHCQRRSSTDANGLVRIEGCPAGVLNLAIDAPGYVRVRQPIELPPQGSLERVDLEPAARVSGQVVDEEGAPLSGVTLTARLLGAARDRSVPEPWIVLSDPSGTFQFDTLPEGKLVLDVSDGGVHEPQSLSDVSAPSAGLAIKLRRTAAISGKVSSPGGGAAPGALVILAGSGIWPARNVRASADGSFDLPAVPEGIYELRAEHETNISAPIEGISVQPGARVRVEIVLSPSASLSGRVRDATSGRPLAAAELDVVEEALSARARQLKVGADGSFQLAGLRAIPHRVTVRCSGYVTQQRWLTPGTPASLELLRAAAVSGKVVDASGRSVPRAELEVSGRSVTGFAVHMVGPVQEAPPDPSLMPRGVPTGDNLGVTSGRLPKVPLAVGPLGASGQLGFQSDEDGEFQIDGLPPGQLVITAHKAGLSSGRSATLSLRAGAKVENVLITLPGGYELRGRVLDARGSAVTRIRVDLVSDGDPVRSTTTGSDGGFAFDFARGACTLWARPFGAPAAKVSGEAQELAKRDVLITLPRSTERLVGRVADERGQPVESASVQLEAVSTQGYTPVVLSESDGSFEFNALPEPPYRVSVEHPDYVPLRGVTVASTRDSLQLKLERGLSLSGVVLDAVDERPVPSALLSFRNEAFVRPGRTARDGSFSLQHLPSGPYELDVIADEFIPQRSSGRLETSSSRRDAPLRIYLEPAASVSGEVVDKLGRTVWNAQVASGTPPDWERAARTDHAGHFLLEGVPEGEQVLHARHGDSEASSKSPVRVVAGEETPGAVIRLPDVIDEELAEPEAPRGKSPSAAALRFVTRGAAVVVDQVAAGSAAERAGLQAGDVLVAVNGEPVRSAAQARGMLSPLAGRAPSWTLDVRRAGVTTRLRYPAP